MKRIFAMATLLVLATSCTGGTDAITTPDGGGPTDDVGSGEVTFPDAAVDSGSPEVPLDISGGLDLPDTSAEVPGCGMESGCFGDPCESNDDCLSGLCLDHMGDMVCSDFCVEECPEDGWECQQVSLGNPDLVFACVSNHPRLCRPCEEDADCVSATGQEARCVVYPEEGGFCGSMCGSGKQCPEGFHCSDNLAVDGTVVKQCVKSQGVCECSKIAVSLVLSTPCLLENEWGVCDGMRYCTATGLSQCDAGVPAAEACDGLDNNCDGETDEDTCDDANPCTKDGCIPGDGCIYQPLDGDPCDDDDSCTLSDQCSDGQCQGEPVACNDGNPCTQDLCDPVTGCKFPPASAGCSDGNSCTFGDFCEDGQCQPGVTLNCDDGNQCTQDACDAEKGCLHTPSTAQCDDTNPCTKGDHCAQGLCVYDSLMPCDDANPCTDDWCDPNAGCQNTPNTAACNDDNLCTLGDVCAQGECQGGQNLNCNDKNPCTDDYCNPLLGCLHTNNVTPCDDLDPCTLSDQCVAGQCVGTGAKDCDDNNPCTTDYCDPMAGCTHAPNSASCDDGNLCTTVDKCQGGNCVGGPAPVCNDNNPCTDDACSPLTGCQFTPNNENCDDNNDCTTDDHCAGAICTSNQPLPCDDNNPCTKDICLPDGGCKFEPVNFACDDGNACTTQDMCIQGNCTGGPPPDCDDKNVCTDDYCNPDNGCVHLPNDAPCSDSNECTTDDQCEDSLCVPGTPLPCNDENVCTTDSCNPKTGCVHNLNQAPCNDNDLCSTNDQCQLGECKGTGALVCNDSNPCTDDSCAPEAGCQFLPNQDQCNDGNECTTGDHCAAGFCTAGGIADCGDKNPCTVDYCDVQLGCVNDPLDAPCDDGNKCTVNDWCADGQCAPGMPANCNDENVCTADDCDPQTGCTNTPQDGECSDGDECTTGDTCVNGSCQTTGTLECIDGNKCTQDSCLPDVGCKFDPIIPCCGNAAVEPPEECDDGNDNDSDACKNNCTTGNVQAPECQNYTALTESVRNVTFNDGDGGVEFCDSPPPGGGNKWYRFQGGAGVKMPTSCPALYACGTDAPGWMQGSYPSINDGQVNRTVCYHWDSGCCTWSNTIKVRNCGAYYVFYLPNTPVCHLSYCGSN